MKETNNVIYLNTIDNDKKADIMDKEKRFDFTGLEEEEIDELQTRQYDSDLLVDNAIERVKNIDAEIERLTILGKQKKEQVIAQTQAKIDKLEKSKQWDLYNLGAIVDNDPTAKETKTQRKKVYISGEVVRKKPKQNLVKPDWDEAEIKKVNKQYQKNKLELDWKEYKKTLNIVDNKVYNDDGELIENIKIENVPAQTIVK